MKNLLRNWYRFLSPRFQSIHLDYHVNFKPRKGEGPGGSNSLLYEITDANRTDYGSLLKDALGFFKEFKQIKTERENPGEDEPFWNNGFLPGLDIVILYTILRKFHPGKYVEIGSGNSTKVVRKAIDDGALKTEVTSIDPYPRANIDHLADSVIRMPLEDMESHEVFRNLEAGDILFIDNSHRSLPNSDVTVCFTEIIPILKPGVVVHIHDIYIPYDYPQFMCDRAYSEQYLLSTAILSNPTSYKTIMPNYFVSQDGELSEILNPLWSEERLEKVEQHGGSFWFVKT